MCNHKIWIVLLLLAIALGAVACGSRATEEATVAAPSTSAKGTVVPPLASPKAPTATPEPPTVTPEPPTSTPEPAATTPPARASRSTPTPVPPTPKPTATPSIKGLFARPDEALDSYRSRSTTTLTSAAGTGMGALLFGNRIIETEFVREPRAMHVTMSDLEGAGQIESITIGADSWVRLGDNWMKSPSQTSTPQADPSQDISQALEKMLEDFESGMTPLGRDEIDGRRCQRYSVDSQFVIPLPTPAASDSGLPANFMPTEMSGHATGEICILDERNFPAVPLRQELAYEVTLTYASGDEEQIAFEELSELYDINEPITIAPPE